MRPVAHLVALTLLVYFAAAVAASSRRQTDSSKTAAGGKSVLSILKAKLQERRLKLWIVAMRVKMLISLFKGTERVFLLIFATSSQAKAKVNIEPRGGQGEELLPWDRIRNSTIFQEGLLTPQ